MSGRPELLAAGYIKSDDRFPVLCSQRDNEAFTEHQRGTALAKEGGKQFILLREKVPPKNFSAGEIQAVEIAIDPKREDPAIRNDRIAAGTFAATELRSERCVVAEAPLALPGDYIDPVDGLFVVNGVEDDSPVAADCRRGVTRAFGILPKFGRTFFRELVEQVGLGRGAVVVRAKKMGPVGCFCRKLRY